MPTVADIREALATSLSTLDGLQASAYMLSNPTPPAAHIFPAEVEYDQTMGRGLDQWDFTVQVLVGLVSDKGAQIKLDTYLAPAGPMSVKQALEQDATLGGLVDAVHVTRSGGYQQFVLEGRAPVLAAEWTVRVWAAGT